MSYGIRVSKEGKEVSSTDIRDFILHSDYSMFKIHTVSSGNITINSGVQTGSVDIAHNLGYVPAFLVYEDGQLFPSTVTAYATTEKIHIAKDLGSPYNQTTFYGNNNDWYDDRFGSRRYVDFGNVDYAHNGALRFGNVTVAQGAAVSSAVIDVTCVSRVDGGENVKFKVYGIDEDNTGDFSSSPMGRDKTTAFKTMDQDIIPVGESFGIDVKDEVKEIVDRANWAYGNNMGFLYFDNGTTNGNKMEDNDEGTYPLLTIVVTGTGSVTYYYKVVVFKDRIA